MTAIVEASQTRRVIGCAALYGLGGLLIYITFVDPPHVAMIILVLALAGGVLVMADALRRATKGHIILREDALMDERGVVLAQLDDIAGVDRGILAFKPSNGFVLTMKSKQPRSWAPGLWWRYGRFLGVGGVVSAGQTKFMAEQIAFALAHRNAEDT
ncbi:MAG: hypothetical protein AAFP98_13215 [Pseudomonadota bacterium]